jgi:ethanolamine utilization protein EutM
MGEALGMIETRGLVAMIEASDAISVHVIPRPHSNLEDVLPIGKAAK